MVKLLYKSKDVQQYLYTGIITVYYMRQRSDHSKLPHKILPLIFPALPLTLCQGCVRKRSNNCEWEQEVEFNMCDATL